MLEELGRCAQLCGEFSEAGRAWEEVADDLDGAADPQRLGDVKRRLAAVYELEGVPRKAAAARLEAADAFEAAGIYAEAAGELLLVSEAVWDDDAAVTERLVDRALQAARRAKRTDLESQCLSSKGILVGRAGRRDKGVALIRTALSLALDGNHVDAAVTAYWSLGATANDWADYAAAESFFDEAIVYCQANDRSEDEHFCLGCLIVVLGNSGDWTRAERLARDLLERPSIPGGSRAHAVLTVGLIAAARGATKRARRLLDQSLALANDIGMEESAQESTLGLALVDELEGTESPRWQELVTMPVESLSSSRARCLRMAATFAARRGDTKLVYQCADSITSWASRFPSADCLAALAHVLGEVALVEGEPAAAAEQFGQALERLAEIEAPFERALTQARAGTALIAAGERELGVERLTGAYRTFQEARRASVRKPNRRGPRGRRRAGRQAPRPPRRSRA